MRKLRLRFLNNLPKVYIGSWVTSNPLVRKKENRKKNIKSNQEDNMMYQSSKHGSIEINTMALPHIKNALKLLQKRPSKLSSEYEMIGALKQAILDKEENPDNRELAKDLKATNAQVLNMVGRIHAFEGALHNASSALDVL